MTGERRGNIYIDRVPRDSVRHRHFLYLLSEPQNGLLTFIQKKACLAHPNFVATVSNFLTFVLVVENTDQTQNSASSQADFGLGASIGCRPKGQVFLTNKCEDVCNHNRRKICLDNPGALGFWELVEHAKQLLS